MLPRNNLLSFVLCLVWSALALWGSSASADRGEVDHSASIDRLFEKWDQPNAPGFAVGVILNGKFVHQRGYGIANLDADIPITSKTSFDVMSLAKSFTTACAARLFDQGVISPDSDVRKYVPELPEYDSPVMGNCSFNSTTVESGCCSQRLRTRLEPLTSGLAAWSSPSYVTNQETSRDLASTLIASRTCVSRSVRHERRTSLPRAQLSRPSIASFCSCGQKNQPNEN